MVEQNKQKQTEEQKTIVEEGRPDGMAEIFPGGPTENQVQNWKQEYGDSLYMTEFDDETFVWRTLSRIEYKRIMSIEGNNSEWFGEEQVVQKCILWPENFGANEITNGKAGVPSVLSDQIMAKSGFVANSNPIKL